MAAAKSGEASILAAKFRKLERTYKQFAAFVIISGLLFDFATAISMATIIESYTKPATDFTG